MQPTDLSTPTQWAIRTQALSKHFPTRSDLLALLSRQRGGFPAVHQVDLSVRQGELFGLLGPNGAGKTTLIKLLCTLIEPTSGAAWVNGYPLVQADQIKASIGLVTSDERSFFWRLSGQQNLAFFAALAHVPAGEIPARVAEVSALAGLEAVASKPFQTYSTGYRQRLALARALLNKPRLLFLDEPTKGLDRPATRSLHHLIREELLARQQMTILLTTHYLEEAEQLCDRIALLNRGQLAAVGSLPELRRQVQLGPRFAIQVGGLPEAAALDLPPGVSLNPPSAPEAPATLAFNTDPDQQPLPQVLAALQAGGAAIQRIDVEETSLERIFTELTEKPGVPLSNAAQPTGEASQPMPAPPPKPLRLAEEVRTALQVSLAFLKRDVLIEISYRTAFIFQLTSVFVSMIVFYFIAQLVNPAASPYLGEYGGDYFAFVLIGLAFSGYFGVGLASFSTSIREAQTTGTLEAMFTTPNRLSLIILSSSLWSYLFTTFRVLIYLIAGALLLGVNLGQGNYLAALTILGLALVSFSSLGIIAAAFVMVVKRGDPITFAFSTAAGLFGGLYYPVEIMPGWLQSAANLLPVTYALRGMRLALLQNASLAELLPEVRALLLFGAVLLPLSLWFFRVAVQRARQEGSLAHY